MIKEFIDEVSNRPSFNYILNQAIKTAQAGCIIVYLFFLISAVLYSQYINVTIIIVLVTWFGLIMFSTNYFIYEKYALSIYKKNKDNQIKRDISFIEELMNKYELSNNVESIKFYIEKKIKDNIYKLKWRYVLIAPISLVFVVFLSDMHFGTKIVYALFTFLFTLCMSKFVDSLKGGIIYKKEQSNYQYIYFCMLAIDIKRNSQVKTNL